MLSAGVASPGFGWMRDPTYIIGFGLLIIAILVYFLSGRKKAGEEDENALLHLLERITNTQLRSRNLESELRDILHQPDEVIHDPFAQLIQGSPVVDILGSVTVDDVFNLAAAQLGNELRISKQEILTLLRTREQESSTVITPFVAIPHIILEGQNMFKMFVARCRHGIRFSTEQQSVKAVFVILGTKDERHTHLKTLADIAKIVQAENFEDKWLVARDEPQLRTLLMSLRKR
jgi:APA family basic amino acid/polyamine antiporter